jgi:hypothetical protein
MRGIENEPMSEAELRELEEVMERHKTLREMSQVFGVFTSFCVPRLLVTIQNLQRQNRELAKERDEARAMLLNLNG